MSKEIKSNTRLIPKAISAKVCKDIKMKNILITQSKNLILQKFVNI